MRTQIVSVNKLREGDIFPDGVMIVRVEHDPEGVWLETDDGEVGGLGQSKYRIQARS